MKTKTSLTKFNNGLLKPDVQELITKKFDEDWFRSNGDFYESTVSICTAPNKTELKNHRINLKIFGTLGFYYSKSKDIEGVL